MTIVTAALLLAPTIASASQHERTNEPGAAFDIEETCPPDLVPVLAFVDVGPAEVHAPAIECVAWFGVTTGGPGGRPADEFGPDLEVSRGQMASFIARTLDTVDEGLLGPWDGVSQFVDVPADDAHASSINRLADAGVVVGGPGDLDPTFFGPAIPVDRAQMATFINSAQGLVFGEPFSTDFVFFDDLDGVLPGHADNINALAWERIAVGRPSGDRILYDPAGTVRRNQMASFLARKLARIEHDQPGSLGFPVRIVSSFTTPLVPGQDRNVNIHLAADYIDGDRIEPGGTYSLNQGIGPRTRARGFVENGFIDEGEVISVVGGGVSQMGTTFLNAAWFAGIDLVEFRPHTIYFERYPMCREATLAWELLDVVVTNDSPHPITVVTEHSPSSLTVSFVSTPWARVDSWIGQPYAAGGPGGPFSVDCGRTVTYPDGTTAEEDYTWRYDEGFPG